MKKQILSFLWVAITSVTFGQNISDSFDTYSAGSLLASQSNGLWTTWSNSPGGAEDAIISDDYSVSGVNSAKLEGGGFVDVVLPLGDQTSGTWNMSFMMLIPSGNGAYFNMLHSFNGSNSNWAFDVLFSESGSATLYKGGGGSTNTVDFSFEHDKWLPVSFDINIDLGVINGSIDGEAFQWDWTIGSSGASSVIGALNLYAWAPEGETGLYYVDDVSFELTNIGLGELDGKVSLFPNPVSNQLTIDSKGFHGGTCEIISVLGAQVYKKRLSSNQEFVDCSSWTPGVYFLQITEKSGSVQRTKFMVE